MSEYRLRYRLYLFSKETCLVIRSLRGAGGVGFAGWLLACLADFADRSKPFAVPDALPCGSNQNSVFPLIVDGSVRERWNQGFKHGQTRLKNSTFSSRRAARS